MAKPHGKILMGREGGKQTAHWYDFVESKARILRSKRWDGGCPSSKPGTAFTIWLGYDEFGKAKWRTLQ